MAISTPAVAATFLCLALTADVLGQNGSKRELARYDFEDKLDPGPAPRDWDRGHSTDQSPRPGFPSFNAAVFDRALGHRSTGSLKLPCAGGSASCRLLRGVIPVYADADYAVSAMVRTLGLEHARAVMTVQFLDRNLQPILTSQRSTVPLATGGQWAPLELTLLGGHEQAAWLDIDLQLLQPRLYQSEPVLGELHVWSEDHSGAAWFDDVVVRQIPRVELSTSEETGLYRANEHPELNATVRDLVGESLTGVLRVFDLRGRLVDEADLEIDPRGIMVPWTPELPSFGWYDAVLEVQNRNGPIGTTRASLLWLAPRTGQAPTDERQRFGIIADRLPEAHLGLLPQIVSATGTGFCHLWVWQPGDTPESLRDGSTDRKAVIDRMIQRGQDLTFVLNDLPNELTEKMRLADADVTEIARLEPTEWGPYLLPLMNRFGQRVRRWQIDLTGSERPFWDPDLGMTLERVRREMRRLVPSGRLAVAWRADRAAHSASLTDGTTVTYPSGFGAEMIAWHRETAGHNGPEQTMVFELPGDGLIGREARVIELAKRGIEAWATVDPDEDVRDSSMRLAVDHPWYIGGSRGTRLLPAPELGVWRTLTHHLAGRRVIAEMPTPPGTRCLLLASVDPITGALDRGGLVGWNVSARPEHALIDFYLGTGTRTVVDLFGNATASSGGEEAAPIPLGRSPVFVEGIDPRVASFIASYRVVPGTVRPIQMQHTGAIELSNPWPEPISGRLKLVNPRSDRTGSWDLEPSGIVPFNIPANETQRIPISFAFGPSEEAGDKPLDAVVRITVDRPLPPIRLFADVHVGLTDLELEPTHTISNAPDGEHVVIIATVTNAGDAPRTLSLEVRAPASARIPSQRVSISNLGAGESVRKRFLLKDAAPRLRGERVRVRIDDPDQLVYLLETIEIQ